MNILKFMFFNVLIFLLVSCNNDPRFDLLDITLAKDDVFMLVKDEKHSVYPGTIHTSSEEILNLGGLNLSNQGRDNYVVFYYNINNKVFYYSVQINQEKSGNALLNKLVEKLGEADYFGYEGSGKEMVDFNKETPSQYIWEDKINNRLFILSFERKNQIIFRVMINPKKSEDILGMARAGYWGDFVDKRIKINNSDYTYKQFIKDDLKDGFPSVSARLTHGKK